MPPAAFSINVLNTNVFATDRVFQVQLRMWNICNPYDADYAIDIVAPYMSPVNLNLSNGDATAITTISAINLVQAPLAPTVLPSPATFCVNLAVASYNLTASGVGGATFRWYTDAALTTLVFTGAVFNPNTNNGVAINAASTRTCTNSTRGNGLCNIISPGAGGIDGHTIVRVWDDHCGISLLWPYRGDGGT